MKTTVINLFGAPGTGKTVTALGLTYTLNREGFSAEYVDEFAKGCAWDNNINLLCDQNLQFTEQHRKLNRVNGKTEFVVMDSPLLLSNVYRTVYHSTMYSNTLDQLVFETHSKYHNVNFLLDFHERWNQSGRVQDHAESQDIQNNIIGVLEHYRLPYSVLPSDWSRIDTILEHVIGEPWKTSV